MSEEGVPSRGDEEPLTAPAGQAPDEVSADQVSLARRLKDPRTIVSIALPIVLAALVAINLRGLDLPQLGRTIVAASPLFLLAAFVAYYAGFPIRGYRWLLLLRGTGFSLRLRDSTEIIFISWLVNCLVPAKLGDVYRAYLLRLNYAVSLSRTFGTVFIERVFDIFAIAILGLAAGFWSFRSGLPGEVQLVLGVGVAVLALLAVGLYTVRNFGRRTLTRLRIPARVVELYDRFEEGVFSIAPRQIPALAVLTALVWTTEALRLLFVIEALNFRDVHLGISGAFFLALSASLLTAIPFTPAGLGIVEGGVIAILTVIYRVDITNATAIALVDRAISVLSVIILGGIAYVISNKTKGGRHPPPEEGEPEVSASPA